jgi:hypothetical protein
MKAFKFALITLAVLIIFVLANYMIIDGIFEDMIRSLEAIEYQTAEEALLEYTELYEEFERKERYISLSVSHNDLTSLEESFAELIGTAKSGDMDGITAQKYRLSSSLLHIRRLSGINIDSIF